MKKIVKFEFSIYVRYREFCYAFPPYVYFRFGQNCVGGLFLPVMSVLRCVVGSRVAQSAMGRQPTTEILLSVQQEVNIRRHRSPGVPLPSRGFRIVDLRVQTAVFAVSVKPEVVVSRPEVVLRDRKWLLPAQLQRLR